MTKYYTCYTRSVFLFTISTLVSGKKLWYVIYSTNAGQACKRDPIALVIFFFIATAMVLTLHRTLLIIVIYGCNLATATVTSLHTSQQNQLFILHFILLTPVVILMDNLLLLLLLNLWFGISG